jgi:hypothetical protein
MFVYLKAKLGYTNSLHKYGKPNCIVINYSPIVFSGH